MSSQSSRSDGGRGRLSRDERVKLFRKDRSRTSGRESGRGDHFEHCRTARSRTSGRDLNLRGYSDSRKVARSRTSGRESDGGRKQVLDENANRDKRSLNNDDNIKDERSPFRLNNNDMKRESQVEQIMPFFDISLVGSNKERFSLHTGCFFYWSALKMAKCQIT